MNKQEQLSFLDAAESNVVIPFPNKEERDLNARQRRVIRDWCPNAEYGAKETGNLGFLPTVLIQATLPYRDPDPENIRRVWFRETGNYRIDVTPGELCAYQHRKLSTPKPTNAEVGPHMGFPYGSIPRVILAWTVTQCIRTKSPEITIGNSLSSFMREVGFSIQSGGANGSITRFREQAARLFASRLVVHIAPSSPNDPRHRRFQLNFAKGIEFVDGEMSSDRIVLSDDFFAEVQRSAVPLDMRAVSVLRTSPLSIDLYCWLTWRMSFLEAPTTVSWEQLKAQFGQDVSTLKKFRELFRKALEHVQIVYSKARVDASTGAGLVLQPSPPHVSRLASSW